MKNKIVIACDPGNESCGIAVFNVDQKGTFDILWRSTLDPWSLEAPQSIYLAMELLEMGLFTSQTSIHFFYFSFNTLNIFFHMTEVVIAYFTDLCL